MPLPAAVAIPPAAGAFYAGAAAASKYVVIHAGPYLADATYTLSYATIGAWLLRYLWRTKVPAWAKEDVSFQALLGRKSKRKAKTKEEDDDDDDDSTTAKNKKDLTASEREEREMANLSSVLEKLQSLIDSVQLDDDHPSVLQQYAALLAFIQLSAQIKRQEQQNLDEEEDKQIGLIGELEEKKENDSAPNDDDTNDNTEKWTSRDSLYEMATPSKALLEQQQLRCSSNNLASDDNEYQQFAQNPTQSCLYKSLQRTLEFATWAYYDNSETLEEKLAEQDFELLLHNKSTKPGHASYFLAVSSIAQKQVVVGIRGTSTLEDIVTDCCGNAVPLDDRPYYYDHDKGSKLNRMNNSYERSSIEVKAATELQIILTTEAAAAATAVAATTATGSCSQDFNSIMISDHDVEIISGHERIWVEEQHGTDDTGAGSSPDDYYIRHSNNNANSNIDNTEKSSHDDHMLRCHEGIMVSAKRLVDKIEPFIEDWVVKRGYQLVLCGHSLGAGCASLAAVLLRSRLPELTHDNHATHHHKKKIKVFCFAPPPVLDRDAALAASSYTTSIVNQADMIPRCSLENLLILLEILKGIWTELSQQGLAPTGPKTTAAFFRKVAKGTDSDMLMTAPAVRSLMRKAMTAIQSSHHHATNRNENIDSTGEQNPSPGSSSNGGTDSKVSGDTSDNEMKGKVPPARPIPLYVPGVVLLAYRPWQGTTDPAKSDVVELETKQGDDSESIRNTDIESDYEIIDADMAGPAMIWKVTDGTATALRFLELDSMTMAMEHASTSYYSLLNLKYEF